MIEILQNNNKYVPTENIEVDGEVIEEVLKTISFGGDQLTEERAINAQLAFRDGDTKFERFMGTDLKFED